MSRGQPIDTRLLPAAIRAARAAIEDAEQNEVFFVGRPGDGGLVGEVEVICRGNAHAVPALLRVARHGDVVLHNHPSGNLSPSEPDLALAGQFGNEGVGFYIIDNQAARVYAVVEPPRETPPRVEREDIEGMLGPSLASALHGAERREGQIRMASLVASAQQDRSTLVVEAGTGTGKSLAYLVPSALRARQSGERIAVATATIPLQNQLRVADMPVLRRLVGDEIDAAVLVGRGNYLCKRKLQHRLDHAGDLDEDERARLDQIAAWADVTGDGTRADLPFMPSWDLWESVQSNTEHTLRARCPHYDSCFYYRARKEAARARVLLVNHHLLLADLKLRAEDPAIALLPKYEHIVIDEAHHLEDAATAFAGAEVTEFAVLRRLGRLVPSGARRRGLLRAIEQAIPDGVLPDDRSLRAALAEVFDSTEHARAEVRVRFPALSSIVRDALRGGAPGLPPEAAQRGRGEADTLRLLDTLASVDPGLHERLAEQVDGLLGPLFAVAKHVESLLAELKELPEEIQRKIMQERMELGSVQRRMVEAADTLSRVLKADAGLVRWLDASPGRDGRPTVRLNLAPVDVAKIVRELLQGESRSVVATSATLSVEGGFAHFRGRIGLGPGEAGTEALLEESIPSPFDYGRQVLLGIASELPEPDRPGYDDAIAVAVAEAVRIASGRTFVLLTSYAHLRRCADSVGRLLGERFQVLRQGDLPREQLLSAFRAASQAVLFGTDSFWEGVDVRGEALSCVILPRLPFRVPTEPVQVARAEAVEREGRDPFKVLSIPQAVLKFRQGFGRLIRHREDRGVVLVLDSRIASRWYGRAFLRSLPEEIEPVRGEIPFILDKMQTFFHVNREGIPDAG